MRPVNLLPAGERRRSQSAKRLNNSSFAVLGILGVLLLGSLYYVTTGNRINSGKTDIAKAKQETAVAKARSAQLGPFAEFAKVKETRETSVRTLASQRFDWERLMREIGLVLPEGTSIQNLDAATSGDPASSSGGSTSAPAPATGTATDVATPSMELKGCAKKQDNVATMLVRLRALHGVEDVDLNDSEKPSAVGTSSGGGGAAPTSGSSGTAQCHFYQFDVTVTFTSTGGDDQTPKGGKVSRRLGGGA